MPGDRPQLRTTAPPAAVTSSAGSTTAVRIEAGAEIARLRSRGYGMTEIARSLNARNVPTPSGRGYWWPDTVRRQLDPAAWAEYMRRYRRRRGW